MKHLRRLFCFLFGHKEIVKDMSASLKITCARCGYFEIRKKQDGGQFRPGGIC